MDLIEISPWIVISAVVVLVLGVLLLVCVIMVVMVVVTRQYVREMRGIIQSNTECTVQMVEKVAQGMLVGVNEATGTVLEGAIGGIVELMKLQVVGPDMQVEAASPESILDSARTVMTEYQGYMAQMVEQQGGTVDDALMDPFAVDPTDGEYPDPRGDRSIRNTVMVPAGYDPMDDPMLAEAGTDWGSVLGDGNNGYDRAIDQAASGLPSTVPSGSPDAPLPPLPAPSAATPYLFPHETAEGLTAATPHGFGSRPFDPNPEAAIMPIDGEMPDWPAP